MMTLDQIARTLGFTQALLQSDGGYGRAANKMAAQHRRTFMVHAFELGHDIADIAKYLDRGRFTILHGLRMHCMQTHGAPYEQSPAELRQWMGVNA